MSVSLPNWDELVPFQDAPGITPGRPHVSTLHRWRTRGVRGVKLATLLVGGRRFVTRRAIAEFVARINSESVSTGQHSPASLNRERRLAAAERRFREKVGEPNSDVRSSAGRRNYRSSRAHGDSEGTTGVSEAVIGPLNDQLPAGE